MVEVTAKAVGVDPGQPTPAAKKSVRRQGRAPERPQLGDRYSGARDGQTLEARIVAGQDRVHAFARSRTVCIVPRPSWTTVAVRPGTSPWLGRREP
jgi:hypothetical protein